MKRAELYRAMQIAYPRTLYQHMLIHGSYARATAVVQARGLAEALINAGIQSWPK
jgi:hypothetical protein